MSKIDKNSLGYLGFDFQVRLILNIIIDKKFGAAIMSILNPNYFEDKHLRLICAVIKNAYEQYEIIPDMGSLESRILESVNDEIERTYLIAQLRKIKEASVNDVLWVQDTGMKFCKQQELKKSIREIQKIIDKGDHNEYEQCETILKKALEHGDSDDTTLDVFDGISKIFKEDYREPIPTGIKKLDEIMNGGIAKGELGIILAALGVGKTTMITKFANTAKNLGYNVLQIFFEDKEESIQSKHVACWSGYELNDLKNHEEELMNLIGVKQKEPGILKLKRFASDSTTIPIIRKYIRKKISQGFKPDMVLIDYMDCIQTSKSFDDANVGEGFTMRQFETMLSELDIAGWCAIQGNRSATRSDVVEVDQMGGSIKKAQIGHFILSVGRTLDQRDAGVATISILKSRFGKDGLIFQNIIFDNKRIHIDMEEGQYGKTHMDVKKETDMSNQDKVKKIMEQIKLKKENDQTPPTT